MQENKLPCIGDVIRGVVDREPNFGQRAYEIGVGDIRQALLVFP